MSVNSGPVTPAPKAPEPPVSQVENQMKIQGNRLDGLSSAISRLEEKLQPILTEPEPTPEEPKTEPGLVSVAHDIEKNNHIIEYLIHNISGLLARTEV